MGWDLDESHLPSAPWKGGGEEGEEEKDINIFAGEEGREKKILIW